MDTTADPRLHRRCLLGACASLSALALAAACGTRRPTTGSSGAAPTDPATPSPSSAPTVRGIPLTEVPDPIELGIGESISIELGHSHPSVGMQYYVVIGDQRHSSRIDDPTIGAEITHISADPGPIEPGGDRGHSVLTITGTAPGEQEVRVLYCFQSAPDRNGSCDQERVGSAEGLTDETFRVRVEE